MADDDLRAAVHEALYRAAVRFGADEVAAIEAADGEVAALDAVFGAQRHYWRARAKESRNRQIQADLAAGRPPEEVAAEHGVSLKTVQRAKTAPAPAPDLGFGSDDWVIR